MARNTFDSMRTMHTMHASELDGSSCCACCLRLYGESASLLGVQEVVDSNPAVPILPDHYRSDGSAMWRKPLLILAMIAAALVAFGWVNQRKPVPPTEI